MGGVRVITEERPVRQKATSAADMSCPRGVGGDRPVEAADVHIATPGPAGRSRARSELAEGGLEAVELGGQAASLVGPRHRQLSGGGDGSLERGDEPVESPKGSALALGIDGVDDVGDAQRLCGGLVDRWAQRLQPVAKRPGPGVVDDPMEPRPGDHGPAPVLGRRAGRRRRSPKDEEHDDGGDDQDRKHHDEQAHVRTVPVRRSDA